MHGPAARYACRRFGKTESLPLVFCTRFRAMMDHWDPALLDLLAAEREIIVFDNVGTGASTGTTPATIQGLADGAVQFIQVHRGAWAAARVRVGSPASRPSRSR